jgi:HlyD family secretion protein
MRQDSKLMSKLLRNKKLMLTVALPAIVLVAWLFSGGDDASTADVPLIPVQKGTLQINVLQGGEIRALSNHEVKSEIELPTKILSLIPEGYRITDEDVKNGKVLIELDSADIKDKITTHEIEFQTTVSAYIEADEQRAIQLSDNQSLARDAEQAMRFALMDFERYMGKQVASSVLTARKLPQNLESLEAYSGKLNAVKPRGASLTSEIAKSTAKAQTDPLAEKEGKVPAQLEEAETPIPALEPDLARVDFVSFLNEDKLGDGEAQQKLRQLSNDMLLRKSELTLAKQNVEASERLAAKDFITKTTLENDQVNYEKAKLAVQTAETQLDLFNKYEFSKQPTVLAWHRWNPSSRRRNDVMRSNSNVSRNSNANTKPPSSRLQCPVLSLMEPTTATARIATMIPSRKVPPCASGRLC